MKKLILLALALMISSASLFASNENEPIEVNKELRNQIVKLLQTPDFTIEKEMNVILTFTFSSEGEIIVLCAGCKHKDIVNYIRKNLNHKKFENPGEHNKIYKMPLKIRTG